MASTEKAEPVKAATPGWPRPRAAYRDIYAADPEMRDVETLLPVPWILSVNGEGQVIWTKFHEHCAEAHFKRLCQVCGEELGRTILLGNVLDAIDYPGLPGRERGPVENRGTVVDRCRHYQERRSARASDRPLIGSGRTTALLLGQLPILT